MLLLDANVCFKKHCLAALYTVFILECRINGLDFLSIRSYARSLCCCCLPSLFFFFVRRFCYLLFGGSLDFCIVIVCTTQHTSCVSTTRLYQCFAYVMVNSIRCKKLLCEQRKLTLSDSFVVRPIECMHLTPLNVLHAMRM